MCYGGCRPCRRTLPNLTLTRLTFVDDVVVVVAGGGVDRLSVLLSLPFPEHYVITSLLPPPLPLPPFNGLCHVTHEGVFWGLPTLQALSQQNTHTPLKHERTFVTG